MNTETLEYPEITDAPRADVAVAAPAALDLRKIDLTDVALSKFGDWRKETADTKAELDNLALDLSTQARIDEAVSLRHRKINAPLALARKASAGLKSKLTSVSKSVGAELEAIESAWADVATAITPQIEAAQKKIDDAKEAARLAEEARLQGLRAAVDDTMNLWVDRCTVDGITAERIGNGIAALRELPMPQYVADVAAYWTHAKAEALVSMTRLQHEAAAREEAARLEAQRLENERVAAEQRAEAERLAEQQRLLAEQAAELQRKVDAIAAQEREARELEAARAESERLTRLAEERRVALRQQTVESMKRGGLYNWKGQPDRLIYLRKFNGWHQFQKIGDPREVWCEVRDEDLHRLEETPDQALTAAIAAKGEAENPAPAVVPAEAAWTLPPTTFKFGGYDKKFCPGSNPDCPQEPDDYIPPVVADFELKPQTEAEIKAADGPEVDPLPANDPVWGDRATVSMADINARLGDGITLTSDFLRLTLQIPTAGRERAAYRFYASDWPSIRAGLIDHIEARA